MNRLATITVGKQRVDCIVLLASANRKSLLLDLGAPIRTTGGAIYLTHMPLLMDEAGEYRDLIENQPVKLEWTP